MVCGSFSATSLYTRRPVWSYSYFQLKSQPFFLVVSFKSAFVTGRTRVLSGSPVSAFSIYSVILSISKPRGSPSVRALRGRIEWALSRGEPSPFGLG
jgi:hypothetical protein